MRTIEVRTIKANTNAEFLNELIDAKVMGWMRSVYPLDADTTIWMIRLDGKVRRGFKNYIEGDNIVEYSSLYPTRTLTKYREVFDIKYIDGERYYIYMGRYTLNKELSTNDKRVFSKVI